MSWKPDNGYYVESVTIDGKQVTVDDKTGGSYIFNDIREDHEVVVVCKESDSQIVLTKTIAVDDIYFEHGNPSYIFKVDGADSSGNRHTYYQSGEFDEDYVKKNTYTQNGIKYVNQTVKFDNVPAGKYTAQEIGTSRYQADKVTDVTSGSVQGTSAVFDLKGNNGTAVFTNANTVYRNNSHNDMIINQINK